MTDSEKERLNIYNNLSDEELANMTDEDFADFEMLETKSKQPTQTYKEQAPGLLARVKASGYSGLSDDDKKLYDAQYKYSQAARSGMTLDEARQMADDAARKQQEPKPEIESALPGEYSGLKYDDVRKGLAAGFSPILGAWDRFTGVGGNIGSDKSYPEAVKRAYERGADNEGVAGELANPLNWAAEAIYPARFVGSHIYPAAKQAVAGFLSNYVERDPNSKQTMMDALKDGLYSGLGAYGLSKLIGHPADRLKVKQDARTKLTSELGGIESDISSKEAYLKYLDDSYKRGGTSPEFGMSPNTILKLDYIDDVMPEQPGYVRDAFKHQQAQTSQLEDQISRVKDELRTEAKLKELVKNKKGKIDEIKTNEDMRLFPTISIPKDMLVSNISRTPGYGVALEYADKILKSKLVNPITDKLSKIGTKASEGLASGLGQYVVPMSRVGGGSYIANNYEESKRAAEAKAREYLNSLLEKEK